MARSTEAEEKAGETEGGEEKTGAKKDMWKFDRKKETETERKKEKEIVSDCGVT